jgi:hypothetical protein
MTMENIGKLSSQRLFQYGSERFVLLTTDGVAVAFRVGEDQQIHVIDRQVGVDFQATGDALKQDGWRCVGPGLEYSRLLEDG